MKTTLFCATTLLAATLHGATMAAPSNDLADTRTVDLHATRQAGNAIDAPAHTGEDDGLTLPAHASLALAALGAMAMLARRRGIR